MTTIEETMDEFFNFEDAAHPLPHSDYDTSRLQSSGPYDIDLAFAEPYSDENAFTCLQHFTTTPDLEQQLGNDLDFDGDLKNDFMSGVCMAEGGMDMSMMGAQEFSDFPRWIDGMDVPSQPCEYCEKMRIHCKVLKEGERIGSCTSCVALDRGCSLRLGERAGDGYDGANIPFRKTNRKGMKEPYWGRTVGEHESGNWGSQDLGELIVGQHSNSAPDLKALNSNVNSSTENLAGEAEVNPKVGARFSRESVRVLRGWLSTHHRHPYPSEEEKESLMRQTQLNKTQITNWLANARRRGKVRAPRSTSPSPQQFANGMDIPRRATPAPREMNPMERWKNSPPEHEPASVTAIAKAVSTTSFSSGHDSPYTRYHSDDGSARSLAGISSTSSLGTSHSSGGSFASAFSHKSRGSFGSFNSFGNRGRRRRRQAPKPTKPAAGSSLYVAPRTFQCTFCTETFKTKHDWQRHEKSLHLSLERWVCSPNGHTQYHPEHHAPACVYCGATHQLKGHAEQHNYSSCAERSLEERTFYRKDHLRQHLNLVHDAKFSSWSMDSWKVATPEIRSRCGFCGIIMDSWSIRVDHLAEHFKGGKSMADWKGDWGFEPQVLDIVENGMPPYLIHDERNSPRPFEAKNRDSPEMGKTLEDQVKTGLVDFINEQVITGAIPTDEDLLEEARKVIRKSDAGMDYDAPEVSWFRDLIMLSGISPQPEVITTGQAHNNLSWADKLHLIQVQNQTEMNDLNQISCAKERALKTYVRTRQALGLTPTDEELQVHACKILDDIEHTSNFKCKGAVQWFKYLITIDTAWLAEFRRRAVLPRSSEMADRDIRPSDDKTIDYSIHNYHRLERELVDFVNQQRSIGRKPSDADLQAKARMIIYESDDAWNQTAADDPAYLEVFKRQYGLATIEEEPTELPTPTVVGALGLSLLSSPGSPPTYSSPSPATLHWDLENTGDGLPSPVSSGDRNLAYRPEQPLSPIPRSTQQHQPLHTTIQNQPSANSNPVMPLRYFLNDANCYGRLVRELIRFVTACLSPNNPTSHIPSDAELQNQARWVIYDDDDPWNQTAADNAEWLIRFKRDVGLLPKHDGPGLPYLDGTITAWSVAGGGTGFSPPFLQPGDTAKIPSYNEPLDVKIDGRKSYQVSPTTADNYVKDIRQRGRYQPPASVFCSRDLEQGLAKLVKESLTNGVVPSDDQLRARARAILGVEKTAADDVRLLEKFKSLHGISSTSPTINDIVGPVENYSLPNFTDDVSMLAEFDLELGAMDLTTPFGSGVVDPAVQALIDPQGLVLGDKGVDETGEFEDAVDDMGMGDVGYADIHRVNMATASPLRRRASERLAKGSFGYEMNGGRSGIGGNVDGMLPGIPSSCIYRNGELE